MCIDSGERSHMKNSILKFRVKTQALGDARIRDESGQDLIEYPLVVSRIVLGATAGMSAVATNISTLFRKPAARMYTS